MTISKNTNIDPKKNFDSVYKTFQKVEKITPHTTKKFFKIGPSTVCFRFAGSGLPEQMIPAIKHLAIAPVAKPDLTICAFDSSTTGVQLPPLPWCSTIEKGTLPAYSNDYIKTAFFIDSCIFGMLNIRKHMVVYWIKDINDLPYYERCFPMRALLHWWFRHNKKQIAHVAAVGTPRKGILLVGNSGSGKSTTALSCLTTKDLFYVGDDYVLLSSEPSPYAYSLSNSAKLNQDSFERLSLSLPNLRVSEKLNNKKSIVFIHSDYPKKVISGFPIKAVFIPRISGTKKTKIIKTTPAKALLAIAPSTVIPLPGTDARDFKYLMTFVSQVPNYFLELSTDCQEVAGCIKDFLSTD